MDRVKLRKKVKSILKEAGIGKDVATTNVVDEVTDEFKDILDDLEVKQVEVETTVDAQPEETKPVEIDEPKDVGGKPEKDDDQSKELEELKAKIAQMEAEHEAEKEKLQLDMQMDMALTTVKAKNTKAVKALLNMDEVKFDKDGKVKGLQEQLDEIIESDPYLFGETETTPTTQKKTYNPPAGDKSGTNDSAGFSNLTKKLKEASIRV